MGAFPAKVEAAVAGCRRGRAPVAAAAAKAAAEAAESARTTAKAVAAAALFRHLFFVAAAMAGKQVHARA